MVDNSRIKAYRGRCKKSYDTFEGLVERKCNRKWVCNVVQYKYQINEERIKKDADSIGNLTNVDGIDDNRNHVLLLYEVALPYTKLRS